MIFIRTYKSLLTELFVHIKFLFSFQLEKKVRTIRDVEDDSDQNSDFDCSDKADGFYSDLSKCGSYYECRDGVSAAGECVGNYEWNSQINKCDVPKNSDCTRKKQEILPNSTATPPSNLTDHSKEPTTTAQDVYSSTSADEIEITTKAIEITTESGKTESSTEKKKDEEIEPTTDKEDEIQTTTEKQKDEKEIELTTEANKEEKEVTTNNNLEDKTTESQDETSTDADDLDPVTEKPGSTGPSEGKL